MESCTWSPSLPPVLPSNMAVAVETLPVWFPSFSARAKFLSLLCLGGILDHSTTCTTSFGLLFTTLESISCSMFFELSNLSSTTGVSNRLPSNMVVTTTNTKLLGALQVYGYVLS
eukprot:Gb_10681 [translate_table: standard]